MSNDDKEVSLNVEDKVSEQLESLPEAGIIGKIINKISFVFAASIVLSATILIIEIFLRYVFNSPTIWVHETTTFLCGSAFIFGGIYCTSNDKHIRVVLIYDFLSDRARRIMNIFISFISFIATAFFVYAGWLMVVRAFYTPSGVFRLERSGSAWNPPTPALLKGFLFCILILLALQYLVLTVNYFKNPKKGLKND